jgi:hypothetical protein
MLPELTQDEFSSALDGVAAGVLANIPQSAPPVDALALARTLGLAVAWDEQQLGRGRMARLAGRSGAANQGSILLRPDPRRERLQWAVAHEIGEWCAHQVFRHLSVDPREAPPAARESVANQLASRILLPRDDFERDARDCGWDLLQLKTRYATASHELIARRMLDFTPAVIITIFDQGRRTFRRGNLPFRAPPLGHLEQAASRACLETAETIFESDSGLNIQVWPIHEAGWKREIMRTEWLAE